MPAASTTPMYIHSSGPGACTAMCTPVFDSMKPCASANPPIVSATPSAHPSSVSNPLSNTSSDTIMPGRAPTARSTAISRRRASSDEYSATNMPISPTMIVNAPTSRSPPSTAPSVRHNSASVTPGITAVNGSALY